MKKSLIVLLAFLVVGALAYAAEPTAELKITEFTGNASVTGGADLDQMGFWFRNDTWVEFRLQLAAGGSKATTGDGIWGALTIKTDGGADDVFRGWLDNSKAFQLSGPGIKVDSAKLMIGTIAYIGILQDGTQLNYAGINHKSAGLFLVDKTQWYGLITTTTFQSDISASVPVDWNSAYGIVLGLTPAGIGNFTVDLRTPYQWQNNGPQTNYTFFGIRAQADITAVPNLTAKVGASTTLGGALTDYDIGASARLGYKVSLGDPLFVYPEFDVDFNYSPGATAVMGYSAQADVQFGFGGSRSHLNLFFSADTDFDDWGYYPGITAGVQLRDADMSDTVNPQVGASVTFWSGALIPNLGASAAFEIRDVLATQMVMGFNANVKYDIAVAPMTLTPKFGVYYMSDPTQVVVDAQTDIYVKAGLDIAKIFPNTTLSFLYQSNDFQGGVNDSGSGSLGAFTTTLKISF